MAFKRLISALLNKAQVVEKLSELRPIRRAAQLTAYALMKAKIAGKEAITKLLKFKTVRQIRHEASGLPKNAGEMGRKAGRLRDSITLLSRETWGSERLRVVGNLGDALIQRDLG
uniref:NCBP2 antisense 2 (head to head) n=1 Tax=Oncorhynchus kisutch TaxID=8019 RepID=A0A8C7MMY7_ONCKI